MPCRRCESELEYYELAGRRAAVCPECGFVDVAVSHFAEGDSEESWEEAFERFYTTFGADSELDVASDEDADDEDVGEKDSGRDGPDESDDEEAPSEDADDDNSDDADDEGPSEDADDEGEAAEPSA